MGIINNDSRVFNETFSNYLSFVKLIFDEVESKSEDINYLEEALPYLESLAISISVLRGQFFSSPKLRPSIDISMISQEEEKILKRIKLLKLKLNPKWIL